MFPASIILPAILGFWTLQVLALIYLLFYSTVWLSLFIKSILKKNRPYPVNYILLAPFLQILVSIGVIIGATLSLMPQK